METVLIEGVRLAQNKEGKEFTILTLIGGIEMVESKEGTFYATARKCRVTSTFSHELAKTFIGSSLPGKIVRVECEPYSYFIEESGKEIELSHKWQFVPASAQGLRSNANFSEEEVEVIS
jgi:hypothetical protein